VGLPPEELVNPVGRVGTTGRELAGNGRKAGGRILGAEKIVRYGFANQLGKALPFPLGLVLGLAEEMVIEEYGSALHGI